MTKRINWSNGEYQLVLGLYFKLPYLNGVMPTPQDIVRIISEKFGIDRTVDSIKIRLNNFISCDPEMIAKGVKGMVAGRDNCQPHFDKWVNNKQGLLQEIQKILSGKNATKATTLELISILPTVSEWSNLELCVLLHLCRTRVPNDKESPILQFFCAWFDKEMEECMELLGYFHNLFLHNFVQIVSPLNKLAEDFFSEYSKKKSEYQFAGKLYWDNALQTSIDLFTDLSSTEVIEFDDTVEVEDPISKLVEELSLAGASRLTIVKEAMKKFPEQKLSLSGWADELDRHFQALSESSEEPTIPTSKNSSKDANVEPTKKKGGRSGPRLKLGTFRK